MVHANGSINSFSRPHYSERFQTLHTPLIPSRFIYLVEMPAADSNLLFGGWRFRISDYPESAESGAMPDFTTDFTLPASFFIQAILFKDTSLVWSLQMDPSTPFPGPTTASGFQHYVHALILDCFIHPCGNVGCPPDQSAVWRLTIPDIGLSGIS